MSLKQSSINKVLEFLTKIQSDFGDKKEMKYSITGLARRMGTPYSGNISKAVKELNYLYEVKLFTYRLHQVTPFEPIHARRVLALCNEYASPKSKTQDNPVLTNNPAPVDDTAIIEAKKEISKLKKEINKLKQNQKIIYRYQFPIMFRKFRYQVN